MNVAQHSLILFLRMYRTVVSPVLAALAQPMGMGCRFTPTCSQYAAQAVQVHGACRGGALAIRRLCRCHPWGGQGEDPVPPRPVPAPHHQGATRNAGGLASGTVAANTSLSTPHSSTHGP